MAIKLGVNGFGRIGRYLVRLLKDCPDLEIAVINARADNATLAHFLNTTLYTASSPALLATTTRVLW
jgi:glyceraldehyde-3-phosphate dehydrogenase (EC 1.2.1.12)